MTAVLTEHRQRLERLAGREPGLGHERNMFGVSAIHAAHFTGRPDLVSLIRQTDRPDAFSLSVELGEFEVVRSALGADPRLATSYDDTGSTALHGACYWGQTRVTELLIRAGADVSAATRGNFLQIAPLGSAVATTPGLGQPSDSQEVVLALGQSLLSSGADPNQVRLDGMTALHTAAWRGPSDVARELIDAGADPPMAARSGPHRGETPAESALSRGHLVLAANLDPDVGADG